MPTDLDLMTLPVGDEYELFEHANAWQGEGKIFVRVNSMTGGIVYQIGYDPAADKHHFRILRDGAWTSWNDFVGPPKPVEEPKE